MAAAFLALPSLHWGWGWEYINEMINNRRRFQERRIVANKRLARLAFRLPPKAVRSDRIIWPI
jgi:hypothetical protein